jgi:CheY-like chemotaxis protein
MSKADVLLIDDERPLHQVFTTMLRLEGYDARAADDVEEAKTMIEQQAPDVILCDLMMPITSGLDFLMECKADDALRHIPIIMVTAYGLDDLAEVAMAMGAFDVLPKPFTRLALLEVLEAALAGGANARADSHGA